MQKDAEIFATPAAPIDPRKLEPINGCVLSLHCALAVAFAVTLAVAVAITLAFAFAVAVAVLVVIPEGDLLFPPST